MITMSLRSLLLFGVLLAGATAAQCEPSPLNVPILLRGSIGQDACPEQGRIIEVGSESESFLPVQSGPGEAPFREIGRLREGDMVVVCEKLGTWLGVVYGSAPFGCRTTILVPLEQAYTGPCDHGWIIARNVSLAPN